MKWTYGTSRDVTAHPAVEGNFIYFPDSAGYLYKLEKKTGAQIWKRPISDYTGAAGESARGTPAISGNLLILGNLAGRNAPLFSPFPPSPARVFAVDKNSGNLVWATQVDDPLGSRSEAPVSGANDVVFGCNLAFGFGRMVAMNAKTGAILWSYDSGGMCNAGASISNGMVIWGSGTFAGTGVKKVFGFGLPGGNDDD